MTKRPASDGHEVRIHCRLCEAICGMVATVSDGRVVHLAPNRESLHSRGHVCVKGVSFLEVANDPARVLTPLKRTGGPGEFTAVGWNEALDDIAARLKPILAAHGPESFAAYLGNPAVFSSLNFFYGMGFVALCGSSKVYSPAAVDTNAVCRASELLYGNCFPLPLPDLPQADLLYIFGANPLVSNGSTISAPMVRADLDAIHGRSGVVAFDPRRSETARAYEHVAVRPAGDAWLVAAMLRIIRDAGLFDRSFVAAHVRGTERLEHFLDRIDLDAASAGSGVPLDRIRMLALRFAQTERAAVYARVGLGRNRFATLSLTLVNLLAIVTGKFGKPGTFGFAHGLNRKDRSAPAANYNFAGSSAPSRSRIGDLPLVGGHHPATMLAADILEPGPGQVKAFMTLCGNPVLSLPNGLQMEAAMRALSLHFSIDLYITESNRFADYILPAATFLERQDHAVMRVQSMMRRVLMASPAAVPPPGQARAEPEIFAELARRMGADSPLPMMSLPPQAVAAGIEPGHDAWADIALRLSEHGDHYGARPEGLTVEKLIRDHPDGYALPPVELLATSFDHIAHADGRIHITAEIEDEMERLLAGAGETGADLELIGRRNLKSLNSWLHNAPRLIRSQKPSLLIHPFDARDRGLKDGEPACIRSNAGETIVTIKISDEMMRGVVSYPHGFGHVSPGWPIASAAGGININCLSSTRPEDMERISGSALLDGIAVRVERLPPSANR